MKSINIQGQVMIVSQEDIAKLQNVLEKVEYAHKNYQEAMSELYQAKSALKDLLRTAEKSVNIKTLPCMQELVKNAM